MAEGGNFVVNDPVKGDLGLNRDEIDDKEHQISQHFDANEREHVWFREKTKDGSLESKLQMLPRLNDHSFLSRDNGTASTKFRWVNLLPESSNAKVEIEGRKKDYGRKYPRIVEHSWSSENERVRNLPTYVHCGERTELVGVTRKASGDGDGDGRGFRVREYPSPHLAREMSRKRFEEGSFTKLHSNDSPKHLDRDMSWNHLKGQGCHLGVHLNDRSYSLGSRSQCSDQHTPCCGSWMENLKDMCQEALDPSADLYGKGVNIHSTICDGYQQMSYSKADENEVANYPRAEHGSQVDTMEYYIHPECQRCTKVYPSGISEHIYDHIRNVKGYDNQGDGFTNNLLDHTLQNLSNIDHSRKHVSKEDSPLQRFCHALHDEPTMNDCSVNWLVDNSKNVGIMFGSGNTYLDYESQAKESLPHRTEATNNSHESLLPGEVWAYENDAHDMFYKEEELYFSGSEGGVYALDELSQQRLHSRDVEFGDKYDRKLKRKHKFAEKVSRFQRKTSTFHDKGVWSYDGGQHIAEIENEPFTPTRRISQHEQFQARQNVVPETEPMLPFSGLSESLLSRLSKPGHESGSCDVKKRLKHSQRIHNPWVPHPKSWRISTKHSAKYPTRVINAAYTAQLNNNGRSNVWKRKFKATPQNVVVPPDTHDSQVSHTPANIEWQQNPSTKTIASAKEACHSQEADLEHAKLKLKPTEKDLAEDSGEFKRQVDEFFMKCMLHLCANSDRQKRFKGQGKDGCLKCIICSSSKEFVETKDVAMHAFTSPKVGLRAPHLGFHKALCVLMGWESVVATNARWVLRPLPDAEAWALKEDIIIWPPVVIIHNSVGGNHHLHEQAKISSGHLKNILRDKGFDVGKTRVCCGGAENSTTVVVKFSGTLSGLQEAERLHNIFTEKKHGRNELQQVNPELGNSEKDTTPQMPIDDADSNLYGYLGILEDLDKLDRDMKLHCHAKSKKQILAFVNAAT